MWDTCLEKASPLHRSLSLLSHFFVVYQTAISYPDETDDRAQIPGVWTSQLNFASLPMANNIHTVRLTNKTLNKCINISEKADKMTTRSSLLLKTNDNLFWLRFKWNLYKSCALCQKKRGIVVCRCTFHIKRTITIQARKTIR